MAGAQAILQQAEASLRDGRRSVLGAAWRNGGLSMAHVLAAARGGDELSRELFRRAGTHIGVAVASLVNVLNPSLIIVGGTVSQAGDDLLQPIIQTVRDRALRAASVGVRIVPGELGREATALGAVTLVLQEAYRSPGLAIRTQL
jgi:glucokinase